MNNGNVTKVIKLAVSLAIICMIAGGGLALTYGATEKKIEEQAREQEMKSNKAALPTVKSSDDFKTRGDLADEGKKVYEDIIKVYEGTKNGQQVGWVMQVGPRGYGGPLVFAVGIDMKGKITGLSIIDNRETPGLGQNIEKPEFQKQFKGKSGDDALEVGKDIDAITGATISSRAVIEGAKGALQVTKKVGGK